MTVKCTTSSLPALARWTRAVVVVLICGLTWGTASEAASPPGYRALHKFTLAGAPSMVTVTSDGTVYGVTALQQLFRITPAGQRTI